VKKHAEYQYIKMHMNAKAKMDCEIIWHSYNNAAIKTQKVFYVNVKSHHKLLDIKLLQKVAFSY
jgi:hypothetical protein